MGPAEAGNAISFGFPRIYRGAMIFVLVACFGFIGFCGGVAAREPGVRALAIVLGGGALFAFIGGLSVTHLSRLRDRISVDDNGISYMPRRGPATFIGWNEVGKVEARDSLGRLVVRDVSGSRRINLEYQLEDFDRLREIVLQRTAEQRQARLAAGAEGTAESAPLRTTRRAVFYAEWRTWAVVASPLAAGVVYGLIVFGAHRSLEAGQMRVLILYFVILAAGEALLVAWLPWRITLSDDAVIVRYPFSHRVVPYRAIVRAELRRLVNSEGRRLETVRIELKDGRVVSLRNLKSEGRTVYEVLSARCRQDS